MKSNYHKTIIGAVMMALFLIAGFGLSTSTARAQQPYPPERDRRDQQNRREQDQDRWRPRDDNGRNQYRSADSYPNFGDDWGFRQTALNAGYNAGIKEGRNDHRHGREAGDLNRFNAYRKATADYNSRGDLEHYRSYFQLAFRTGYLDGLEGN